MKLFPIAALCAGVVTTFCASPASAQQGLTFDLAPLECPVLDQIGRKAELERAYDYAQPQFRLEGNGILKDPYFDFAPPPPPATDGWWYDKRYDLFKRDVASGEEFICPEGMDLIVRPDITHRVGSLLETSDSHSTARMDGFQYGLGLDVKLKTNFLVAGSETTAKGSTQWSGSTTNTDIVGTREAIDHATTIAYKADQVGCEMRPIEYWNTKAFVEWNNARNAFISSGMHGEQQRRFEVYDRQLEVWDNSQYSPSNYESTSIPSGIDLCPDSSLAPASNFYSDLPTSWGETK